MNAVFARAVRLAAPSTTLRMFPLPRRAGEDGWLQRPNRKPTNAALVAARVLSSVGLIASKYSKEFM